mgnify:CR=1 FL=1|tara:strand:+ start:90 stop:779 length:690 start_codon:yes stop_codon:yes gene_type:complete
MDEYIKKASKRFKDSFHEKELWSTKVYIKDSLPKNFDLNIVLNKMKNSIHKNYFRLVDYIMIGQFDFLEKKEFDAAYDNGTIYLRNDHEKELNMADDIIHEVAHAVEEKYQELIYSDNLIQKEFSAKRQRLYSMLEEEIPENLDIQSYLETDYSSNFDNFLYYDVGYPLLRVLTSELFFSPYGITSLSEYFANGFEGYHYDKSYKRIRDISPELFKKIELIDEEIKNGF